MAQGLLERLPYRDVTPDGLVLTRDGKVGLALRLDFPPTRLLTKQELAKISDAVAVALRQSLPVNSRARVYLEAFEGELLFPDRFQRLVEGAEGPIRDIAEARKRLLRLRAAEGRVRQWQATVVFQVDPVIPAGKGWGRDQYEQVLASVQQVAEGISAALESGGLHASVLKGEEVVAFLWRYLNPSLRTHRPPERGSVRERVGRSMVDNTYWDRIRVGRDWVSGVSVFKGPSFTQPGTLDWVFDVPGSWVLVIEYGHPSQFKVSAELNLRKVQFRSWAEDMGSRADPEMVERAKMIEEALIRRARSGEHIIEVGFALLLFSTNWAEVLERRRAVASKFQSLPGVRVVGAPPNALELWESAAPFAEQRLPYHFRMLDRNAAMLFPHRAPWSGQPDPIAFYTSREGTLVGLNPFDPRSTAYNGIVVGGSGSGKTFFTQSYLAAEALESGFIAVIDQGGGYVPFFELIGGQILWIGPEAGFVINPFDLEPGQVRPDESKKAFLTNLLRLMIPSQEGDAEIELAILKAAIDRVYAASTTEVEEGGRLVRKLRTPTLSMFRRILERMEEAYDSPLTPQEVQIARSMAKRLINWTAESPFGRMFDGETTLDLTSNYVYFEVRGLRADPTLFKIGVLLIAELLWRRIQRDVSKPKMVVFDEVWMLFENREAAYLIEDLFRRARRYNTGILAVTQALSDFKKGYASGILQNVNYFFLMPAPDEGRVVQEILKVPDEVVRLYDSLTPKKEVLFLLRSPNGLEGDVIRYEPTALEQLAFGTSKDEQEERALLSEQLGSLEAALRYKHLASEVG